MARGRLGPGTVAVPSTLCKGTEQEAVAMGLNRELDTIQGSYIAEEA